MSMASGLGSGLASDFDVRVLGFDLDGSCSDAKGLLKFFSPEASRCLFLAAFFLFLTSHCSFMALTHRVRQRFLLEEV